MTCFGVVLAIAAAAATCVSALPHPKHDAVIQLGSSQNTTSLTLCRVVEVKGTTVDVAIVDKIHAATAQELDAMYTPDRTEPINTVPQQREDIAKIQDLNGRWLILECWKQLGAWACANMTFHSTHSKGSPIMFVALRCEGVANRLPRQHLVGARLIGWENEARSDLKAPSAKVTASIVPINAAAPMRPSMVRRDHGTFDLTSELDGLEDTSTLSTSIWPDASNTTMVGTDEDDYELKDLARRFQILECWDHNKDRDWGTWTCGGVKFFRETDHSAEGYHPIECWNNANRSLRKALASIPGEWQDEYCHSLHPPNRGVPCHTGFNPSGKGSDSRCAKTQRKLSSEPHQSSGLAGQGESKATTFGTIGNDSHPHVAYAGAGHATLTARGSTIQLPESEDLQHRFDMLECWDRYKNYGPGSWRCNGMVFTRNVFNGRKPSQCWQVHNDAIRFLASHAEPPLLAQPIRLTYHELDGHVGCIHEILNHQ